MILSASSWYGVRRAIVAAFALAFAALSPMGAPAARAETEHDACSQTFLGVYARKYDNRNAYGNRDRSASTPNAEGASGFGPETTFLTYTLRTGEQTPLFATGKDDLEGTQLAVHWACDDRQSALSGWLTPAQYDNSDVGRTLCAGNTVAVSVSRPLGERRFTVLCYDRSGSVAQGFDKPETGPPPTAPPPTSNLRALVGLRVLPTATPSPTVVKIDGAPANASTFPKTVAQLQAVSPPSLTSVNPGMLALHANAAASSCTSASDPRIFTVSGTGFLSTTEIVLDQSYPAVVVQRNLTASPQLIVACFPAPQMHAPLSHVFAVAARNPSSDPSKNFISAPLTMTVNVTP